MTTEKKKKSGRKTLYRPWMLVDIYRVLRDGMKREDAAEAIGVSPHILRKWMDTRKSVRYAVECGKRDAGKRQAGGEAVENFVDYVYGQLSEETRKLWDEIHFWDAQSDAYERTKALLCDKGEKVRQELFIHALVESGFDISKALKLVCVPKQTYNRWMLQSQFNELMDEMNWHKKNFFEGALLDLVRARNPQAVLFANKTQNADRGYADKTTVEHTGSINHTHTLIPIEELELPLDVRRALLAAMRTLEEKKAKRIHPIDVQVSTVPTLKALDE